VSGHSRLLKKPQVRHSEGGFYPRNPLFPRNLAKRGFLASLGMTIGTVFQHAARVLRARGPSNQASESG
jgi:hypothetical protein